MVDGDHKAHRKHGTTFTTHRTRSAVCWAGLEKKKRIKMTHAKCERCRHLCTCWSYHLNSGHEEGKEAVKGCSCFQITDESLIPTFFVDIKLWEVLCFFTFFLPHIGLHASTAAFPNIQGFKEAELPCLLHLHRFHRATFRIFCLTCKHSCKRPNIFRMEVVILCSFSSEVGIMEGYHLTVF